MSWLKKGRIVQFGDGYFGYQKVLLGFIPVHKFLCGDHSNSYYTFYGTVYFSSKWNTLESLKQKLKYLENYKNPDRIVRVVRETKLDKALE
jgi:hypothetical protein